MAAATAHAKLRSARDERKRSFDSSSASSVIAVESWSSHTNHWSNSAYIVVNKAKTKFTLEHLCLSYDIKEETLFDLDPSLRIEFANPLSKDFNVIISGPGGRQRVAFYSEAEANDFVQLVKDAGANVILRRSLPPAAVPTLSSGRPLRPISEGQALNSVLNQDELELRERMRVVHSGRSNSRLFRRKSTGSASDIIKSHSSAFNESNLPRSSSLSVKEHQNAKTVWQRYNTNHMANESRGLSTVNTKKKQQSYQSLDSIEISSGSNHSDRDVEAFSDSNSMSSSDEEPEWHGSFAKIMPDQASMTHTNEVVANDKFEKFKFMLAGIEEDDDILDPSQFGILGEYTSTGFDDYPEDLMTNVGDPTTDTNKSGLTWIRKSMEDLSLDVVSTAHQSRRRNSVMTRAGGDTRRAATPTDTLLTPEADQTDNNGQRHFRSQLSYEIGPGGQAVIVFDENDPGTEV